MSFDLHKVVTKSGSCYVEISVKYLLVLHIEHFNDIPVGISYTTTQLQPVKVNACTTKHYEKFPFTKKTNAINVEKGLMVKDNPDIEKLKNFTKYFLESDEN